jgi:hypothetical protein
MTSTTRALSGMAAFRLRGAADSDWLGTALVALGPLLYVYMPRPPVPGSHFLVYPVLAGVLAALVAIFVQHSRIVCSRVVVLLLLLLAYSVGIGISLLLNASALRLSAPAEIFRPLIFAIFLLYGYFAALSAGSEAVHRGLLWAAYGILLGQLLIAVTQIAGVPVFDLVYDAGKSRPFGRLLRATGSLTNPNAFAWIVAQAAVMVSVLGRGRSRLLLLALATQLIVAGGSRTLLLLFPFMFVVVHVLRDPTNLRVYMRYAALAALLAGVFLGVVLYLSSYFPYLGELKKVFATGSIMSISSMAARLAMWGGRFAEFQKGGTLAWFFGVGSRESNAVVDNDFLYVFFRYGGVGVLLHNAIVGGALLALAAVRRFPVAIIAIQYIIFALVFGLVSETLASWHLPLLLFMLLGLALGLGARARAAEASHQFGV